MEYETSLGEPRERNPIDGQPYVSIPAGRFEMGCQPNDEQCLDHEKPRHWVTISKGFWMGRGEVTVGAYRRFTKVTGRSMPPPPPFDPGGWPRLDHPMVRVLWQDGADYCEWAGGRLPTEAEWEYAARGGAGGALFPWPGPLGATNANFGGNHCLEGADCQPDAFAFTAPAGSFAPNGYGLYDVIGNVWEWISDWYGKDYYSLSPEADPAGPASGTTHVVRGGAWDDKPVFMRLSNRNKSHRNDYRYPHVGFRCVLDSWPAESGPGRQNEAADCRGACITTPTVFGDLRGPALDFVPPANPLSRDPLPPLTALRPPRKPPPFDRHHLGRAPRKVDRPASH